MNPAITGKPLDEQYLIAWESVVTGGKRILARTWPEHTGPFLTVADWAFWDLGSPAMVWGDSSSLIVFDGDNPGDPSENRHIFGRRWVPNVTFVPFLPRS
jgi:hypothetical protein